MNFSRRSLLVAAPAVILTPHLLMPVRPWFCYAANVRTLMSHDKLGGDELLVRFWDVATDKLLKTEIIKLYTEGVLSYEEAAEGRCVRADLINRAGMTRPASAYFDGYPGQARLRTGDVLSVNYAPKFS